MSAVVHTDPVLVSLQARIDGEYPLTDLQRQVWTSQRLAPRAPLANMGTVHGIDGAIDPVRFVAAVDRVVRASDALRTVVVDRPGRDAAARVVRDPPRATEVIDLPAADLDRWCRQRIEVPIDAASCSYDSVLLRHGDESWTWWLDMHHVITDAWSSSLVFDAVSETYRTDGPIPADDALPGFYDFVAARDRASSEFEAGPVLASAFDEPTIAPYGPRGPRTTTVSRHAIDGAVLWRPHDRYRAISPAMSTLAQLVSTAAITVHRLDGRRTIRFGIPVHHRRGRAAARVIGPLMSVHPVPIDVDPADTFGAIFDRVASSLVQLVRHGSVGQPLDVPLDVVVNVQTARYGAFAGLPTATSWMRSGHVDPAHPIRVHAYDYGDGQRIEIDLNDGLSTDGSHVAFADHLERTIAAATATPDAGVTEYELATADDVRVQEHLSPPALDGGSEPVHRAIARRLRDDPGRVIAEQDGVELTAGELDQRADRLAVWLTEQGVVRGDRVGIRLPRSLDVLVAVHGVLRTGAAFVMLDPSDPPARHEAVVQDAELALVVDGLPAVDPASTAVVFEAADVGLDDVAYVLYTSGSTGAPKGVPIPHRGLADYLAVAAATYAPVSEFVMPLFSSLVFDLSITSLLLPQFVGGRTVVYDDEAVAALSRISVDPRLTVLKATPSQLELLSRMGSDPFRFEIVIVGGEAFRTPVAERLADRCVAGVRIFNEYGPTEAVVGCMVHEWDRERDTGPDVPIGRAFPGAVVHVLDDHGRRTPTGAWGELYVRRPGMAAGYLRRPDQTAERFVTVDGVDDEVLYRTGDRVRAVQGVLVYGGRADDQLSVNGVRLEPGEIESALVEHPEVTGAVVRVWSPESMRVRRCIRCGLGTDVPDVEIDVDGVCSTCRTFDRIRPQAAAWFRTPADLDAQLERARQRTRADVDCLHLLSGGKDSTYALYQLVERGWRVHALTLDNGYISDGAKANIRRTIADLGISHEFVTTTAMNEIFRDSLDRFSNVCNGCYKTIYTLASARAHERGIPVIVTGLSRGQFFETRLVPHQFEAGRFDPDEIDRTVVQARRAYHRTRDAVTELLPEQAIFDRTDVDVLSEIEFVDFYRYVDVELAEMYAFLHDRAPWVRPADTGRSTNCLVNSVGIHVHRTERGYHNYAEPYSWDVRLGHKTREEALEELDDRDDRDDIERMLAEIGYTPSRPHVLTAWYRSADGTPIDARSLSNHLRDRLPARAIPTAFVHVRDLPLAESTKLDVASLPAPSVTHLGSAAYRAPTTPTEAEVAAIWGEVLHVPRVGCDDDFFDLGGASLAALETIAATERRFGVELPDALVFDHRVMSDFAAAVDGHLAAGRTLDEIPVLDPTAPAPLSSGEEAMLFEYRADPTDVRYNVTRHYTIRTPVDVDRLRTAVARVVERHGPLHTAFDDRRTRLPAESAASVLASATGDVERDIDELRHQPFDLDRGPLVRVRVATMADGTSHVVIGLHHITIDAGTFDLLWDEIDAAYHGREPALLATSYAAHGAWQRTDRSEAAEYWAARRPEPAAGVRLPPPATIGADGYLERIAPMHPNDLATSSASTPFAAALAAAAAVLSAHSRDGVVDIGITASVKDHPSAMPLIGYTLNTLPMRLTVDAGSTIATLDAQASGLIAEALPYRSHPFAEIVRRARADGTPPPDASIMLAYERLAPSRFGDGDAEHRIVPAPSAVNDLTLFVQERADDLRVGVEYRGTIVGREHAQRILDAFADALVAVCRQPNRTVHDVRSSLAGDDLVGRALASDPATPLERMVEHARSAPTRAAVVDATGASLTYGDLLAGANALARRIRHEVPAPRRIGVSLGRSCTLIEAIVGVQLTGAAYVPIDPTLPPVRRQELVQHADLDAVVVDPATAADFDGLVQIDVSLDGAVEPGATEQPAFELPAHERAAYIIFTSGSTGSPAGVAVSHANLAASTAARTEFYGDGAEVRFLVTPSIGFDSSIAGIFWPLSCGGTVVVPGDADVHDVDRLGAIVEAHGVTHLLMVPSLYRALLARRPVELAGLRTAIVAGEACAADVVERHHRVLVGTELVNEYGPTEATVWATAHRCVVGDDPVPIGTPIPGCTVRIGDDGQRAMAAGAPGELLIEGPGVVDGYVSGRADDRFVADGDHRWYRTGDVARVDHEGRLLFLGRVDDQLNVGGRRIEPVEIERHLVEVDGVTDAVVVATSIDGRDALVAHVAGTPGWDEEEIRTFLAERVDPSALPHRVVAHERLPRTPNGKLDRSRAATLAVGEASRSAPPDAVVGIWRRALRRDDLAADADFFAAGGDSLAAVEIVSALGALLGREVPISSLLTAPTPASMATHLGIDREIVDVDTRGSERVPTRATVELLTLRPGAADAPLVIVTPAWDSVMGYRALADAFDDDVRVLAVVVAAPDGSSSAAYATVDELSAAAMEHVVGEVAAAPRTAVVGWSIGGVVAFDLAQRLASDGRRVDAVALIDTVFPGEYRHLWSNRWWKYKSLLRPSGIRQAGAEFGEALGRRGRAVLARIGRRLLTVAGEPPPPATSAVTASGVPLTALDHAPSMSSVPVTLYAADTTNPARTEHRWRTVAPELRVVPIEGRHRGYHSVMDPDRVHQIVDDLTVTVLRQEETR